MSLSLVASDVVRCEIYPNLNEEEFVNFTQINKEAQKMGRNSHIWKEKLEHEIQNGRAFRLEGFDPKTQYVINKTPVDVNKLDRISKFISDSNIVNGFVVVAGNLYIFSEILANFESNKATLNHYCPDQGPLISVPYYIAGTYLMFCYHTVKAMPISLLFIVKSPRFFEDHIKSRAIKLMKIFSYFAHTSQVPDRTLPFYAACLEKGVRCASKTQAVFRRIGNFFSGGN